MVEEQELHVVFGSGPLGRATAQALLRRGGRRVRLVNRSGRLPEAPAGVELAAGDAADPQEALRLCQGAAVVYQCACPPYAEWVKKFPGLQASILEGAAAAGARLVIADNLYMYGDVKGVIHEEQPWEPVSRKGLVRAQMAQDALEAHRAGRVRLAIGRGSDFFGPWVLGSTLGARAFRPLLAGKSTSLVGNPDMLHTFTYIEDFGEALAVLGERPEALGGVWHVPNSETFSQRQVLNLAFELAGLPPKISGMRRIWMALGGLFIPEARESVEMMYQFEKPFVVESNKFQYAFGMQPTPLRQALQATLDWHRAHSA